MVTKEEQRTIAELLPLPVCFCRDLSPGFVHGIVDVFFFASPHESFHSHSRSKRWKISQVDVKYIAKVFVFWCTSTLCSRCKVKDARPSRHVQRSINGLPETSTMRYSVFVVENAAGLRAVRS